jgi:hypothetical protein
MGKVIHNQHKTLILAMLAIRISMAIWVGERMCNERQQLIKGVLQHPELGQPQPILHMNRVVGPAFCLNMMSA